MTDAPIPSTPDRWARFLDEHSPGLTWLAATLLEWAELPPFARRAWRVTASTTRAGDVLGLAALHDESGLLALAAAPEAPPPFLGEPDRVRRLVGGPEALDQVFEGVPMLAVRRLPGFRRTVTVFDGEAGPRHAMLRRARADEWEALERLRREAGGDPGPAVPEELAGPAQRGLVWVLEGPQGVAGMLRVEGVSRRRVQIADLCVRHDARGRGLGTALARSAGFVARTEYARGAVLAFGADPVAERTARSAGYAVVGALEDVRLA